MDDQQALKILSELIKEDRLNAEEKEAITKAIGILSWTSLAKNRFKHIKERRQRMLDAE